MSDAPEDDVLREFVDGWTPAHLIAAVQRMSVHIADLRAQLAAARAGVRPAAREPDSSDDLWPLL